MIVIETTKETGKSHHYLIESVKVFPPEGEAHTANVGVTCVLWNLRKQTQSQKEKKERKKRKKKKEENV